MAVEGNGGVGAHTFKLQEVALAVLLLSNESPIVSSFPVQIA